ncbi:MAG: hypothetical protein ACT4QA_15605 [Panacagrimonas sp.]
MRKIASVVAASVLAVAPQVASAAGLVNNLIIVTTECCGGRGIPGLGPTVVALKSSLLLVIGNDRLGVVIRPLVTDLVPLALDLQPITDRLVGRPLVTEVVLTALGG